MCDETMIHCLLGVASKQFEGEGAGGSDIGTALTMGDPAAVASYVDCSRAGPCGGQQHRRPSPRGRSALRCGGTGDGAGTAQSGLHAVHRIGPATGDGCVATVTTRPPSLPICAHNANRSSSASSPASLSATVLPSPLAVISLYRGLSGLR